MKRGVKTGNGIRHALLALFIAIGQAVAQPNSPDTNDLSLAPPYGRIEPGFWELYGTIVIVLAFLFAMVVALVIWLALRPRRIAPPPFPGVVARQQLAKLAGRPEDGACLSAVSQVLRRYFIFAFRLADGELNTSEFCAAITVRPDISTSLAAPLKDFLRQCDEHKFSPAPGAAPLNAVHRAQDFLAQAEAQRAASRLPTV